MSVETFTPRVNKEFNEYNPGTNTLLLDINGSRFGFMFLDDESSVLGWPGLVDFAHLQHELIDRLSSMITHDRPSLRMDSPSARAAVDALFVLSSHDEVEYHLADPAQYAQYKKILETPDAIVFARYDIVEQSGGPFLPYSVTAENPKVYLSDSPPTRPAQLALGLPKGYPWSSELLDWVVAHHSTPSIRKAHIDLRASARLLSTLSADPLH